MGKVFETDGQFLKDRAEAGDMDRYEIAVWPSAAGGWLASNADAVQNTSSVVFWQKIVAVRVGRRGLELDTTADTHHVGAGADRFVLREVV